MAEHGELKFAYRPTHGMPTKLHLPHGVQPHTRMGVLQ